MTHSHRHHSHATRKHNKHIRLENAVALAQKTKRSNKKVVATQAPKKQVRIRTVAVPTSTTKKATSTTLKLIFGFIVVSIVVIVLGVSALAYSVYQESVQNEKAKNSVLQEDPIVIPEPVIFERETSEESEDKTSFEKIMEKEILETISAEIETSKPIVVEAEQKQIESPQTKEVQNEWTFDFEPTYKNLKELSQDEALKLLDTVKSTYSKPWMSKPSWQKAMQKNPKRSIRYLQIKLLRDILGIKGKFGMTESLNFYEEQYKTYLKQTNAARKAEFYRIMQSDSCTKNISEIGKMSLKQMQQTGYKRDGFSNEYTRPSNFRVFNSKDNRKVLHYTDIKQAFVPDCWFHASMAAVTAQNPNHFAEKIRSRPDGLYEVDLFIKGEKRTEIVDAFLPTDALSCDTKIMWPQLLEKALAKTLNSHNYGMLKGGASRGFEIFTGKDTQELSMNEEKASKFSNFSYLPEYLSKLSDYFRSGCPMTISSDKAFHAYTVVGFSNKNGEEYIHIFNPHNKRYESLGSLPDQRPAHSLPEGASYIGDSTTFEMPLSKMSTFFDRLSVCSFPKAL